MAGHAVFVYGTLLDPDLRTRVCGRRLNGVPARLPDYRRYRLRHRAYPGVIAEPGAEVWGELLTLDARMLSALDRYEDSCYRRRLLAVECNGQQHTAYVYVIPDGRRHLIVARDWRLDAWYRRR